MKPSMRAKLLESRFLPLITFPYRCSLVCRDLFGRTALGGRWLFRSREFANFTYELHSRNKLYLANFVANICSLSAVEITGFISELESNQELMDYIHKELRAHRRGREIDSQVFFGRRVGWYALIRAKKPEVVVETGTEKGLGSIVIAEALLRNGIGRLHTIDVEPSSGLLIGGRYESVIERSIGDSLNLLQEIDQIDFFIHDSDHSAHHEAAELRTITRRLSRNAIVLSDNSHFTTQLAEWAEQSGFKFAFFKEEPIGHWYGGAGIGVAYK
jgi:predicted O-methyltransferase YrrM